MKRYLFLDIDGVLNQIGRRPDAWEKYHSNDYYLMYSKVELLNLLPEGTEIVISSSWRKAVSLEKIKSLLEECGLKIPVIGVTPSLYKTRGHEIKEWLRQHPEECKFAIFDDDGDFLVEGIFEKWIHVKGSDGLKREHMDKAIALLS